MAVVLLQNTDLGLGHQVTSRVLILHEVKHLAGNVKYGALQKEVNEVKEHRIAVLASQLFVNSLHLLVVDDFYFELVSLSPKIFRDRTLWR